MSKNWFDYGDPIWEDNPFAIAAVIAGILSIVAFLTMVFVEVLL